MATKITFRQIQGRGPSPVSVKETVQEVATLVNTALEDKHPFVALTDAGTNKEISIRARDVNQFVEE